MIINHVMTAEDFTRMSFDHPTELIRGRLVKLSTPTCQHGYVGAEIGTRLSMWAKSGHHGVVLLNYPYVLMARNPDTVLGPDCVYVDWERFSNRKIPANEILTAPVELVIEVLSPDDRWTNVIEKLVTYLRSGITEVWVIDPEQRSVAVHQAEASPLHFDGNDELTRPELLPGFSCRVSELFADLPEKSTDSTSG